MSTTLALTAPGAENPRTLFRQEQGEGVHPRCRAGGDVMVVEIRRYLGDTLAGRIHDTDRETPRCGLDRIAPDHRRWYDTIVEANREARYRDCPWCRGGAADRLAATPSATHRD